jgi:hypothetical protein
MELVTVDDASLDVKRGEIHLRITKIVNENCVASYTCNTGVRFSTYTSISIVQPSLIFKFDF